MQHFGGNKSCAQYSRYVRRFGIYGFTERSVGIYIEKIYATKYKNDD